MDLPRIEAMQRYWAQYPPAHVLLAAQVGWRPQQAGAAAREQGEAEQEFMPPQHLAQADFEQLLRDKGLMQ